MWSREAAGQRALMGRLAGEGRGGYPVPMLETGMELYKRRQGVKGGMGGGAET